MGNSSTIFDRPFQINHIQRSLDAHGFPTTTFLVYHNVIVSVDLNKFPFFFPLLSFSTDRWVFEVEGLEGLIGPYAVVAAFACEKIVENMTFCQKKKKKKKRNLKTLNGVDCSFSSYRLFLLSFFCCLFLLLFTFLFISLTFSDSSYVRRYCSGLKVWQSKEKFADTCGRVNSFFPAIAYFSSVFLFCFCLFVFTLCFNLFNCFVFLWHFQILVSSCVQFLGRPSFRAKKKLRNVWTGKIRFEPRIGAEVEIKYPENKNKNKNKNNNDNNKSCGFKNIPIRVDGA